MAKVFEWQFTVRSYELDTLGHVNNAVYHNYLEEGATRASTAAGYSYEWYMEHKKAWMVRKMSIRYLTPLTHSDRINLRTWVSDISRVSSHREYDLRRAKDDQPVVRARANWVYVNMETLRPERIPPEAEERFAPSGELEDLGIRLKNPTLYENAKVFVSQRQVQCYELDPANVVNNGVYLRWLEQAMYDSLEKAGWPLPRMQDHHVGMIQAAHEIDYLRPARYGMAIEIRSQPIELARVRGAWQHEIYDSATGDLLVRDYSVGAFLDTQTGRPRQLPAEMRNDLVLGETNR